MSLISTHNLETHFAYTAKMDENTIIECVKIFNNSVLKTSANNVDNAMYLYGWHTMENVSGMGPIIPEFQNIYLYDIGILCFGVLKKLYEKGIKITYEENHNQFDPTLNIIIDACKIHDDYTFESFKRFYPDKNVNNKSVEYLEWKQDMRVNGLINIYRINAVPLDYIHETYVNDIVNKIISLNTDHIYLHSIYRGYRTSVYVNYKIKS